LVVDLLTDYICFSIYIYIFKSQNESTWNARCRNEQWPNARLECHPTTLITYERLSSSETGYDELHKIATAMQGKNGFEVIG